MLLCGPPTPSFPSAAAPVSPRWRPTSAWMLFCAEPLRGLPPAAYASMNMQRVGVCWTGSPGFRNSSRRNVGLPGAWVVLLLRAVIEHSAGCGLPAQTSEAPLSPSSQPKPSAPRMMIFRSCFPTAYTFACLRIAGRVTASVARLTTGWAGSPLAGRGLHPLDDKPNFMKSSHPHSFRTSLAWSHRLRITR